MCCSVLQCTALCCSVLQCVAVECSVLHYLYAMTRLNEKLGSVLSKEPYVLSKEAYVLPHCLIDIRVLPVCHDLIERKI